MSQNTTSALRNEGHTLGLRAFLNDARPHIRKELVEIIVSPTFMNKGSPIVILVDDVVSWSTITTAAVEDFGFNTLWYFSHDPGWECGNSNCTGYVRLFIACGGRYHDVFFCVLASSERKVVMTGLAFQNIVEAENAWQPSDKVLCVY